MHSPKSPYVRPLLFLCLVASPLLLGACKTTPSSHSVLVRDFLIWPAQRYENTAKTIPPGTVGSCPNGRLVLLTGQTRPGEIVVRDLYDGSGSVDSTSASTSMPYPIDATVEKLATDNQIVRMKNGNLLAVKNGYTWQDNIIHKSWWNAFTPASNWSPGSRNSIYLWYSSNCGNTWQRITRIDPAQQYGGRYAWPQPTGNNDVFGAPIYGIGGYDRTEAYTCPFTGTIYISSHGDGGPFPDGQTTRSYHKLVFFYSTNNGSSWDEMGEIDDGAPAVMTSTPNGRFYAFSASGGVPKLYYTMVPGDPTTFTGKSEVWYNESPGNDSQRAVPAVDKDVSIFRNIHQIAISRISTDANSSKVRIAYNALNGFGRQVYKILSAEILDGDPASGAVVHWSKTISSSDPSGRSLVYGAFIDPDYVDMPSGTTSNRSVFYYIDASSDDAPFSYYAADYVFFYNSLNFATDPEVLSTWTTPVTPGDYFTGGFYWKDGKEHYVPQWREPDGIHAAVIRGD